MLEKLDIVSTKEGEFTFRILDRDIENREYYDFKYFSEIKPFINKESLAFYSNELREPTEKELEEYKKVNNLTDINEKHYKLILEVLFYILSDKNNKLVTREEVVDMERLIMNVITDDLSDTDIEFLHNRSLNLHLLILILTNSYLGTKQNPDLYSVINIFRELLKLKDVEDYKYFRTTPFFLNNGDEIDFINLLELVINEKYIDRR